ncbi:hypothetical protein [Rhodococcoides navarretei]|uniref:Uncharacterized protein n=1 Tax=Rhodococcus navarretei TaxID=3128981 RepID=A0ABU9D0K9_9NOCA
MAAQTVTAGIAAPLHGVLSQALALHLSGTVRFGWRIVGRSFGYPSDTLHARMRTASIPSWVRFR